jgi:hypothetical protein
LVLITVFSSEPVMARRVTVRVGERFAETAGCVGVDLRELSGERLERGLRFVGVRVRPGGAELAAHPRPFGFGEVVEDVPLLMQAAAGDHRPVAEHLPGRLGERFAAVEDEQDALADV